LPDKLHILVTTPDLTVHRQHSVKSADLNKAIFDFRQLLIKKSKDSNTLDLSTIQEQAKTLYDWLIQPIAEDLRRADAQVLMVYLYGEMRYLPLAALYDGKQWLTEKFATAMYTAAANKYFDVPRQTQWKVAGLGVSKKHIGFKPLPAVEIELESIIRQNNSDDNNGVLPGEIHLDSAFTESTLSRMLRRKFPVLHIASHFSLNVGKDTDSFLLLGDGQYLTLEDIGVKKFEWGNLDMLTLSACNTGTGMKYGTGEEVEGLGTLVVNKGARSVLATLWQVSDQSTADFMHQFYADQAVSAYNKAKAIQKVQQAFIQAGQTDLPDYYTHPFHWAPFILMGNWL